MATTTASEKIRSYIDRDLDDPPQSVIKVDELRTLRSDLVNYVLTDQLAKEYRQVFEQVIEAAKPGSGGTGRIGIWVSGFFGSGKSLFAKIAGHVLADTSFGADTARSLFQRHLRSGRREDDRLAELFQSADVYRLNMKLVAFDIMSQHMAAAERNVGLTFLRTFYHSLGLSSIIPIADAEMELQRAGKYDAFKELYATRGDQVPWIKDRDLMTCTPILAQCLAELLPHRYSSPELAIRTLEMSQQRSETQMSIDDVVHMLLRWLDEQQQPSGTQGTPRLMFVADEVGAWAGRNLDRIEQLRAFVEALDKLGQGRIWMLVTSQEKLSDILADLANAGANIPLLQRLEARYSLNVHLDSSEVGTVVADRVLFKKATALGPLSTLWQNTEQTLLDIATRPGLEMGANYPAPEREAFIADYPFLPYQLPAAADIFGRLRGVKVSAGARSMLKVAFDATRSVADERLGTLIPWDQIFDSANSGNEFADEQYLGSQGLEHIEQADRDVTHTPVTPSRVLKVLWLMQYNPNVPRTPRNLARLLVDHLDTDVLALETKVLKTLEALEQRNFVRRDPATEQWKHLSLDEVTVELMLSRIQSEVKAGDVRKEILKLYEDRLTKSLPARVTVGQMGTAFGYTLELEGTVLKGEGEAVALRALRPNPRETQRIAAENAANLDAPVVYWVLDDVRHLEERIRRALAIERLPSDEQFRQSATDRTKDQAFHLEQEAGQLRRDAEAEVERVFAGGTLYYAGNVVPLGETSGSATTRSMVEEALRDRVLTVYTRFGDADRRFRADNIDRLFTESPAGRAGLDSALGIFSSDGHVRGGHILVEPVLQYLQTTSRTSGQDVMEAFAKVPYGWPGDLLRYVAAALFVDGRVAVSDRTGKRYDDPRAQGARQLFGTAAFKIIRLEVEEEALTPDEVTNARALLDELGYKTADATEVTLKEATLQLCSELTRRATVLERARAVRFPLDAHFGTIPGLVREIQEAGSRAKVIRALLASASDLRAAHDDLHRLEEFDQASGFAQYHRTLELIAAVKAAGLVQDGEAAPQAGASEASEACEQLEHLIAEHQVLDEWTKTFQHNRLQLLDAFKAVYVPLRRELTEKTEAARKTILEMPEFTALNAAHQIEVRNAFLAQGAPLQKVEQVNLRGDADMLAANEAFNIAHLRTALGGLAAQERQARARVIVLYWQERQKPVMTWEPSKAFAGKHFKTVAELEAAFAEQLDQLKRQIAEGKEIQVL
ncbi:MAG TPA: BREX system P-loop protein BrxC [Ktedonobacterales bacterium]|jgi:hypothetical protein|nr:BREX system P-loop protein BrxC [Ktedonobacterales bacterium]